MFFVEYETMRDPSWGFSFCDFMKQKRKNTLHRGVLPRLPPPLIFHIPVSKRIIGSHCSEMNVYILLRYRF